ncbi:winged helix-turn-helix domain-containing protein [Serratia fonticola]|uniref:winged helix-turn-helix domain-containing protein n=1 Tax=Serratia fonticola TaxID=47917 RepID=UPI0016454994|nr:winged helix-turn-helix domain-containing protein [Serratia fonticola]MBC3231748.1 winged helix-turn-helix domain-containing protein [Serratia fonticola]
MGQIIINGVVRFNILDGTLYCLDNSMDMVTLNRVTSDLLLLLIKHNGIPLSREAILNQLWEKRGLSSSSNNLNSYVSLLRKALVRCGCDGLICTIPKYGFLFEAEISFDDDSLSCQQNSIENVFPENDAVSGNVKVPSSFWRRKVMGVLVPSVLLFTLFLPGIYDYFRLQSIRTLLFSVEQCQFYLADEKTKRQDITSNVNTIKTMVNNVSLDCQRQANVYFFADKKVDSSGRASIRHLLAYCPYMSNAPCENYYASKYEK